MAEPQQPNVLAAAFPSPPPFYQHFTTENLERYAAKKAESALSSDSQKSLSGSATKTSFRLLDLPPELRYLQPPEPPADGKYRSFGDHFNLNEELPSLPDQGIDQLYTPPSTPSSSSPRSTTSPHSDRALILKRLAKSLLLNFLELMGIMSVNPEQYEEKVKDLRTLFINFHHLLNEYRPHQARESLIMMMESQLDRSRAETEGIEKMKDKVKKVLGGLGQAKLAAGEAEKTNPVEEEVQSNNGEIWEELEREFG